MAYLLQKQEKKVGYHISDIPKGEFGTIEKIVEEALELQDANKQNCKVMMLVELSDLYGAIRGFLNNNFPDIKMSDLEKMSNITERAFDNGFRD